MSRTSSLPSTHALPLAPPSTTKLTTGELPRSREALNISPSLVTSTPDHEFSPLAILTIADWAISTLSPSVGVGVGVGTGVGDGVAVGVGVGVGV